MVEVDHKLESRSVLKVFNATKKAEGEYSCTVGIHDAIRSIPYHVKLEGAYTSIFLLCYKINIPQYEIYCNF